MAVVASMLVGGVPAASAAAPGSIGFDVVEHYDNGISLAVAPGTNLQTCRYFVLATFDEDEAFYQNTPDGPKPFILASRPNQPASAQRAYAEIPGLSYQFGNNFNAFPQDGRLPAITAPPGKLFYIWYGFQTNTDQLNDWVSGSQCGQLATLKASGRSPANARNLLGLFPRPTPVVASLSTVERNVELGEQIPVALTLRNTGDVPLESLELLGGVGLNFNTAYLELVSGPDPAPPPRIEPGATLTFQYVVQALRTGRLQIDGGFDGTISGEAASDEASVVLNVPPDIDVVLSSSVSTATKAGDEFTVVATLTNNDPEEVGDIRAEPLAQVPGGRVSPVSGPLDAQGNDVRTVPLTIPSGDTRTVTWRYLAEERGTVELTAQISGRDPREDSLFFLSESLTVAIEAPGLEVSEFRMQPGSPVPGDFGTLRGIVTNVGSVDVTGIDFSLESRPGLVVIDRLLAELDPAVSPRIETLAVGESREFLIPVGLQMDAGGLATYSADLTMTGTAAVGGESSDVSTVARTVDALELSLYWTTIWDEVKRKLIDDTLDFFEGVNTWGNSSTLGGVTVGGGQGALNAFQKMGDGLLKVNDLLGEASGDGGERLTTEATTMVAAAREYLHTTSAQKMAIDLANVRDDIAVGGVGIFATWLRDVDRAYTAGDTRKVAELLSETATTVAVGISVEQAGARIFTRLINKPLARDTIAALKRAPDAPGEGPEVDFGGLVLRESKDLKDLPTGVPITGETVARAGITADEHGWMIEMAKEHGVAFFVRPRPKEAARWAARGYNAKPMAIKLKSISDLDIKWLGFDDYADKQGLVVLRQPKDPFPEMKAAVERGELEWGGKEIDDIIERYNLRKAEWNSRQDLLDKLNAGDGIKVQRYGKTITTKVSIDDDGLLRFSHNNQPVFSDIDLLSIARPDGTAIPPELHKQISEAAGFGIDGQHGDSVMTSDFPDWATAKKFATQYAGEHTRSGDPLVIVQPDATTLGYVEQVTVPAGDLPGSGYDLYGKITTTYEGAGTR